MPKIARPESSPKKTPKKPNQEFFLSIFQVCHFQNCLANTELKEKENDCCGPLKTVREITGTIGEVPKSVAILNRAWMKNVPQNWQRLICTEHEMLLTKQFDVAVRRGDICKSTLHKKGVSRVLKDRRRFSLAQSQDILEGDGEYAPYNLPVCKKCQENATTTAKLKLEEKNTEPQPVPDYWPPQPMEIDEPDIHMDESDDTNSLSSESDDSRDSDYEPMDDDNGNKTLPPGKEELSKLLAVHQLEGQLDSRLMTSFKRSDPSRKRKLVEYTATGIQGVLKTVTPIKESQLELFEEVVESRKVPKKISPADTFMPPDVRDKILYCNSTPVKSEKLKAKAELAAKYPCKFLAKFNRPRKKIPSDNNVYWKEKYTPYGHKEARIHFKMNGFGMAPVLRKEIRRYRVKKEVVVAIYKFVNSSEITKRTAFGGKSLVSEFLFLLIYANAYAFLC